MIDFDIVKERLKDFEGLVLKPYRCSQNYLSIGIGRNLDTVGISEKEALILLDNDVMATCDKLNHHWEIWQTFPVPAQYVCIDVVFNMGINTWLSFRKTRAYMELGEWDKAADELLDSKYAKQVGRRALFNAEELRKCQKKPQKTTKPIQD